MQASCRHRQNASLPVLFLASIPSPSKGVIDIGPLHIHMYGLMLLLAIGACIWLTGMRWVRLGGDWDLVLRVAVWGVAFGIVGARAYHDLTSWNEVPDPWWGPFAVWQGGLGVWGGIFLGCLAGAVVIRRAGQSVRLFMDAVAPGLLVAQGIGRWGNWFNQELYGKPTDLPWGLKIDEQHRPRAVRHLGHVPSDVPLRVRLRPGARRRPDLDRAPVQDQAARRSSPSTSPSTPSAGPSRSFCASTRRTTSWASGSTSGCRSSSASARPLFFVWWQFFRRGDAGRPAVRAQEARASSRPGDGRFRRAASARVASLRACTSASSSSTSTRSRARSTCC